MVPPTRNFWPHVPQLDQGALQPTQRLLTHTINNNNPYDGIPPVKPRQGQQSVIFEPLQNIQMSPSKFQVTSFIDFQTYLDYFHNYEGYLDKFVDSIMRVPEQPLYQRFMRDKGGDFSMRPGTCDQPGSLRNLP